MLSHITHFGGIPVMRVRLSVDSRVLSCLFLTIYLPWPLLADLFIMVRSVIWSLPSMLGRHTVAFRTGNTPP
jgi:hypothetical protein